MPSIVPETFSYTLTEAMKLGLPIVAFDIGAQASRLARYDRGATVSLDASSEGIHRSLEQCLKLARGDL
jgi:glycosyltransferase involved in cell wall biosynthesis